MNSNNLKDKIALVTGSSQGIGRGIALELGRRGAVIIVNYRDADNLEKAKSVVGEIKDAGGIAVAMECDVTDSRAVAALFKNIKDKFGRLDILANNAGTSQPKDIFEITDEDWDRLIKTNLTSGFYCARQAMFMMRDQRYGRIVFTSSVVGHRGALFGHVHYAATKAGQMGMVKTLARTGAPYGITVNAVAPGIVDTELLHKTHGDEGVKELAKTIPLGLGSVYDIGNAVAFLCSDEAHYITGITLDVNGGTYFR